MLQNSEHELEFGHTAAVVQVGQKVQLFLQFQQLLPLRQVLPVLDQRVEVVDRQSQQRGGDQDVEAEEYLGAFVLHCQVSVAHRLPREVRI